MKEYKVVWFATVPADSEDQAAERALALMRDSRTGSLAVEHIRYALRAIGPLRCKPDLVCDFCGSAAIHVEDSVYANTPVLAGDGSYANDVGYCPDCECERHRKDFTE